MGFDAGLVAEGERCADLDAGGTLPDSLGQFLRPGIAAGQPKRQAEGAEFLQVRNVAQSVHRFALGGELQQTARRRVVPAGDIPFNDEAIDPAVGFSSQGAGEGGGGDDRQKVRALQRRKVRAAEGPRIKSGHEFITGGRAGRVDPQLRGLAGGEPIEHTRNGAGNARSHQHVVDVGEHRPEKRGQGGQLHLLEQIDAHHSLVALLRQEHLHEMGDDHQFHQRRAGTDGRLRAEFEGNPG